MRKTDASADAPQNRLGNTLFLGLPISLLLTVLGLLLLSLLLAYTGLSEQAADLISRLLSPITVFIGALVLGGRCSSKGWLSGILLGLFYAVVLYAFRSFGYGCFSVDGAFLVSVLLTLAAGILGGSLGINLFSRRC